mmetsp:Transcript_99080/g.248399  ORF Transcript_99080/g.248399 Transcript_99080/m.248399 type:complete len:239 (+) Transcript_99080:758-1474(+)
MLEEVTEVILKLRCAKISAGSHEGRPVNAAVAANVDGIANMLCPGIAEAKALEALEEVRLLQPTPTSHVELCEDAFHDRVLIGRPPSCHLQGHAHVQQATLREFHQAPQDFLDCRRVGRSAHASRAGLVQEPLPQDVGGVGAALPIQAHHLLASFDCVLRGWFQVPVIDRRGIGPKAQCVLLRVATNLYRDMEAQQFVGHHPTTPNVGFGCDLTTPDLWRHRIWCPRRSVIPEVTGHE